MKKTSSGDEAAGTDWRELETHSASKGVGTMYMWTTQACRATDCCFCLRDGWKLSGVRWRSAYAWRTVVIWPPTRKRHTAHSTAEALQQQHAASNYFYCNADTSWRSSQWWAATKDTRQNISTISNRAIPVSIYCINRRREEALVDVVSTSDIQRAHD